MENYTETELTETAVKMLLQGSGYKTIRSFLQERCDEEMEDRIVKTVIQYERNNAGDLEASRKMRAKQTGDSGFTVIFHNVFGILMLGVGVLLVIVLWNSGWVSTIPFIMIGAGIFSLTAKRTG